jgi:hypothetical protein
LPDGADGRGVMGAAIHGWRGSFSAAVTAAACQSAMTRALTP